MATPIFKGLTLRELLELERVACGSGTPLDPGPLVDKLVEEKLVDNDGTPEEPFLHCTTHGQQVLMEAREEG